MRKVKLFTKERCGLCDEVKEELARLKADYPHALEEIDITVDLALFEKYRFVIPVVEIGAVAIQAPIDRSDLVELLSKLG